METPFSNKKVFHPQITEKGKMIVTFQPAGKMETFFITLAALDYEPTKSELVKPLCRMTWRLWNQL